MEEYRYGVPAGIYADYPESWKPGKAEKKLAWTLKMSRKVLYENVPYQKMLKGRVMGADFLIQLLKASQEGPVQKTF